MAKGTNDSMKITFGKRKSGKSRKSRDKHDRTSKVYRGQGR